MANYIKFLVPLLVVQVLLSVYFYTKSDSVGVFQQNENLFALTDKVSKITIEDGEKKTLHFSQKDGNWIMPDYFNFPVSQEKINDLLKNLKDLKRSWPVGKTMIAAKQFSVTEDKFERRISFEEGENKLVTLFLGTSPGYKKIYARVNKEELTYTINFNTFDIPTASKAWTEKKFYEIPRSKIKAVEFQNLSLKKDQENFVLDNLQEKEVTNISKANSIISTASNPDFEEVVSQDEAPLKDPVLKYTIITETDEKVEFQFAPYVSKETAPIASADPENKSPPKDDSKDFLLLKVSTKPYVFKIRKSRLDELLSLDRKILVQDKDAPKGDSSSNTAPAAEVGHDHDHDHDHALNDVNDGLIDLKNEDPE